MRFKNPWQALRFRWFGGKHLILTVGRALEIAGAVWHESEESCRGFYLDGGYGQKELENDIAKLLLQLVQDHSQEKSAVPMLPALPPGSERQLSQADLSILSRIPPDTKLSERARDLAEDLDAISCEAYGTLRDGKDPTLRTRRLKLGIN